MAFTSLLRLLRHKQYLIHEINAVLYLTRLKYKRSLITLGVLIFAGTNFRELSPPYIGGYLFSRMSFAGTNFREFGTKIAKFAKISTREN